MALISGSKLGPYEIVAPIGAGGMGEVYRARDAELGRDVAVKGSARFLFRKCRPLAALQAGSPGCGRELMPSDSIGITFLSKVFFSSDSKRDLYSVQGQLDVLYSADGLH